MTGGLDALSFDDCIALLRIGRVGRIALMVRDYPLVFPVNYRLVELPGRYWVAIRTRPGSSIESDGLRVAF